MPRRHGRCHQEVLPKEILLKTKTEGGLPRGRQEATSADGSAIATARSMACQARQVAPPQGGGLLGSGAGADAVLCSGDGVDTI